MTYDSKTPTNVVSYYVGDQPPDLDEIPRGQWAETRNNPMAADRVYWVNCMALCATAPVKL